MTFLRWLDTDYSTGSNMRDGVFMYSADIFACLFVLMCKETGEQCGNYVSLIYWYVL